MCPIVHVLLLRFDSNFTVRVCDGALSQEFYPECYHQVYGAVRPVRWAAIETLQEGLCSVQSNVVRKERRERGRERREERRGEKEERRERGEEGERRDRGEEGERRKRGEERREEGGRERGWEGGERKNGRLGWWYGRKMRRTETNF